MLETHENREQFFSLAAAVAVLETRAGDNAGGGKKLHQGVSGIFSAPHQGQAVCKSTTALGLGLGVAENRSGSRCTGKERDAETGLDYFGARYYGSNMGRWMTPDWGEQPEAVPFADYDDPQTLNLYAYLGNNPVTRIDVNGHQDCATGHMTQEQCAAFEQSENNSSAGRNVDADQDVEKGGKKSKPKPKPCPYTVCVSDTPPLPPPITPPIVPSSQGESNSYGGPGTYIGPATFYRLIGLRTASGAMFNQNIMAAAMNYHVKMGTLVKVTYTSRDKNGNIVTKTISVTVNDTGPFQRGFDGKPVHPLIPDYSRIIDLTPAAFTALTGGTALGTVPVTVTVP